MDHTRARRVPPAIPTNHPFRLVDVLADGATDHEVRRLLEGGMLRCVVHGVLVHADLPDSIELRVQALGLVMPTGAVITDRTAAWLHGVHILPRTPRPDLLPPLQCFSAEQSRMRRRGVNSGERTLRPDEVVDIHGILVTSPLRTAMDLGRFLPRHEALAALDGFARIGVTQDDMEHGVKQFTGMRGVLQLRSLIPYVDPGAESPAESALRLHWIEAGLPRPVTQHEVTLEGRLLRLDLADPDILFAAEYDGEEFHGPDRAEHDRERRAILARAGWQVSVFTKADLFEQGDAYERLQHDFHAAKARRRGLRNRPR